jgi:hypothetical protein
MLWGEIYHRPALGAGGGLQAQDGWLEGRESVTRKRKVTALKKNWAAAGGGRQKDSNELIKNEIIEIPNQKAFEAGVTDTV